ncbi:helix-turn-helix domain-containing protein [Loktanella sp. DJP18]|uniref:helix-turn-helix domain-containing protein n=1 Tax=Loktanella sp. DJP18 TaxID=3409788 RepID=UPI003BB7D947
MGKDDTAFGKAFVALLGQHNLRQTQVAESLDVSRAYVSALVNGHKSLKPNRIDAVGQVLGFDNTEVLRLHRAAAQDAGFRLDLPKDF